ncbi:MAG: pyrroline-5-carboxylate reductase [Pseudomonadota bacterium]
MTERILADLADKTLLLLGCGNMGGALLRGWLGSGCAAERITVVEPTWRNGSERRFEGAALRWAERLDQATGPERASTKADAIIIAVKPNAVGEALASLQAAGALDWGAVVISVAAGVTLETLAMDRPGLAVVRAMPNTPAAVGAGVTALVANDAVSARQRDLAEALSAATGAAVWLDDETQMDAVTAVSGSGPAYVFHMIEALTAAAEAEGLPAPLAGRLARATVIGAGALAASQGEPAEVLRRNVTSPGGTTEAGLAVLMGEEALTNLMRQTVAAAAARSRALAKS